MHAFNSPKVILMKKQYIFIITAIFIFTSCNKNKTNDSDNQINIENDTISSEANKKLTDRNTESGNNDLSEKIKQKIVEIDAKANQSNKVQDTILLDGIENTPVVIWYDNYKQPIKAEYGVTDDGGEFSGNFSFYFINGKLWYSDWINAKFIFDKNTKLKYWLDESWKISETTETANFKEKEQMNLNTLNQLLSKVKFE